MFFQVAQTVEEFSRPVGGSDSDHGESSLESSANDPLDNIGVDYEVSPSTIHELSTEDITKTSSVGSGATGTPNLSARGKISVLATGLHGQKQASLVGEGSSNVGATLSTSPAFIGSVGEKMLQPVQALPKQPGSENSTSECKSTAINLEDFENNTDPFDSVELKTINDLEELKNVLQGPAPRSGAEKPEFPANDYNQAYQVENARPTQSVYSSAVYNPRQVFPTQPPLPPIGSASSQTGNFSSPNNMLGQFGQYSRYTGAWQPSYSQSHGYNFEPITRCSKSTPDITTEDDFVLVSTRVRSKSKSPPPRPANVCGILSHIK